jgi:hypothetical protein
VKGSIRERLAAVDRSAVECSLDEVGWARTSPLLSPAECEALAALWNEPRRFRSRVAMARLRAGVGEYLLVEQRPRSQSRGEVVPAAQGALAAFPNAERPIAGARRTYRARVRSRRQADHERVALRLGVIFHDAR